MYRLLIKISLVIASMILTQHSPQPPRAVVVKVIRTVKKPALQLLRQPTSRVDGIVELY